MEETAGKKEQKKKEQERGTGEEGRRNNRIKVG